MPPLPVLGGAGPSGRLRAAVPAATSPASPLPRTAMHAPQQDTWKKPHKRRLSSRPRKNCRSRRTGARLVGVVRPAAVRRRACTPPSGRACATREPGRMRPGWGRRMRRPHPHPTLRVDLLRVNLGGRPGQRTNAARQYRHWCRSQPVAGFLTNTRDGAALWLVDQVRSRCLAHSLHDFARRQLLRERV